MGCFLSCFKGIQRQNNGWEKDTQRNTIKNILNNNNGNDFHLNQSLEKNDSFCDGVNFATADESESQEDLVYQEAIRSLMSRNDANINRDMEEEDNSLSGE